MNKKKVIIIFIVVTLVLITLGINIVPEIMGRAYFSNKSVPPSIHSPADISADLKQITRDNAGRLEEISKISQTGDGFVVDMAESADSKKLLAVYGNGTFISWNIIENTITLNGSFFVLKNNKEIDIATLAISDITRQVSFSQNGNWVLTPSEISPEGSIGFNIWDTNTAVRIDCFGEEEYCPNGGAFKYSGQVLHPTRDLYFNTLGHTVNGWYGFSRTRETGGSFNVRAAPDSTNVPQITRLAIDPLGDYLAIADSSGCIQLGDISEHKLPIQEEQYHGFSHEAKYCLSYQFNQVINTTDIQLDETHSWIGWLTDEELVIWSLKNYLFPLYMKMKIENSNAIEFDKTGRILAIATSKGILLLDINSKAKITEYPVGKVTALHFSNDGRAMFWSDVNGNIHIWGVK